jgi:hypothetical protein
VESQGDAGFVACDVVDAWMARMRSAFVYVVAVASDAPDTNVRRLYTEKTASETCMRVKREQTAAKQKKMFTRSNARAAPTNNLAPTHAGRGER